MALSDLWTRSQLRTAIRYDLMDPTGLKDWSWRDAELNQYVLDWQNILQDRFEFAWGTATYANTGTATVVLTAVATDINRLDGIWWNNIRMSGRHKEELEIMQRDWRSVSAGIPQVSYQDDLRSVSVWPPPATAGTMIFEYPKKLTFANDASTISIPAWTRYSVVNYACWRALSRPGPNQDLNKAARRKQKFEKQVKRYRTMWEEYMPDKAPSLRPGGRYEGDILNVGKNNSLFQVWV